MDIFWVAPGQGSVDWDTDSWATTSGGAIVPGLRPTAADRIVWDDTRPTMIGAALTVADIYFDTNALSVALGGTTSSADVSVSVTCGNVDSVATTNPRVGGIAATLQIASSTGGGLIWGSFITFPGGAHAMLVWCYGTLTVNGNTDFGIIEMRGGSNKALTLNANLTNGTTFDWTGSGGGTASGAGGIQATDMGVNLAQVIDLSGINQNNLNLSRLVIRGTDCDFDFGGAINLPSTAILTFATWAPMADATFRAAFLFADLDLSSGVNMTLAASASGGYQINYTYGTIINTAANPVVIQSLGTGIFALKVFNAGNWGHVRATGPSQFHMYDDARFESLIVENVSVLRVSDCTITENFKIENVPAITGLTNVSVNDVTADSITLINCAMTQNLNLSIANGGTATGATFNGCSNWILRTDDSLIIADATSTTQANDIDPITQMSPTAEGVVFAPRVRTAGRSI